MNIMKKNTYTIFLFDSKITYSFFLGLKIILSKFNNLIK